MALPFQGTVAQQKGGPKASCQSASRFLAFFGERMDAALQLLPAPATAPGIGASLRNCGAGLASDACIPASIQLQLGYPMRFRVLANIVPDPVRQHADLFQVPARRQLMVFNLLQTSPCRRLLATQTSEPPVKRLQRPHQRLDLANLAALRRLHD